MNGDDTVYSLISKSLHPCYCNSYCMSQMLFSQCLVSLACLIVCVVLNSVNAFMLVFSLMFFETICTMTNPHNPTDLFVAYINISQTNSIESWLGNNPTQVHYCNRVRSYSLNVKQRIVNIVILKDISGNK